MLQQKYAALLEHIASLESVLLAYSGGVDSTFLLRATMDAGVRYLAVTALSPTMPTHDLEMANAVVTTLGAHHIHIHARQMADEKFVRNHEDRCYHCKNDLFDLLVDHARKEGYRHVLDGSTVDDLADYRPGFAAREKHGVLSPLIVAQLTKEEIRRLSREKNLPTWDKPSSPCLSSRFPYGERIDEQALRLVEAAENRLRQHGFTHLRVRKQGDTARIEIPTAELPRLLENALRETVVNDLRGLGFLFVTLDLEGLQSGKLNRRLITIRPAEHPS
ncbi:MAG: ATP-dependent sacrificial sulfur transferase LarE [Magnetococcales bacterium]|nr:ATP-dependent sacrificial sulfur transferase LarE [Magnetococcales bacterium]